MRLTLLLAAAAAAFVLAACGGRGGDSATPTATVTPQEASESPLEEALRNMVLQQEQLPQGLVFAKESFTTNEQLAETSGEPEERAAKLERWGRILGYEATYERDEAAAMSAPVQGVNVSASLYETAAGAGESFADAVATAERTDWQANYSGLREFRQKMIERPQQADEIVWLRLSGFQPNANGPDTLVIDDLIFFRVGLERGFLRVLSRQTEGDDRQADLETVEGWLGTMITNVRRELARSPGEGSGD